MDIKSMLVKLAEEQADKMQEEAMKHLASDKVNIRFSTVATSLSFISATSFTVFKPPLKSFSLYSCLGIIYP